jgi:rod shape determining protein RodA
MHLSFSEKLRNLDKVLLSVMLLITAFGLVMIYSSTINATTVAEGRGAFNVQLISTVLSVFAFFFFAFLDYHRVRDWSGIVYVLTMILLVVVLFTPGNAEGVRRWLDLGPMNLQPSEVAKATLFVVAAGLLSARSRFASSRHHLFLLSLVLFPAAALVLEQPDLGTALMFVFLWFGLIVAVGVKWRYIAGIVAAVLAALPLLWQFMKPYQRQRLTIFLDPASDPRGAGYNVIQAMIANGAGGIWGVGLGRGTQSQYKFLPVRHTDFIFSVIAEELGLIGSVILLGLYAVMYWRILDATDKASDNFGRYLCIGAFVLLFLQTFINVGMNMGVMPVTGIPLPMVSYGGSSLLVTMAILGIVQSVIIHSRRNEVVETHLMQRIHAGGIS